MTWLLTQRGNVVDIEFLNHDRIELPDIAHSLAHINRFTGHAVRAYSVAEHSLLVCEILERDGGCRNAATLLAALLHDAHEAIIGDVSTPMKRRLDQLTGGAWSREEARVQRHVLHRFDIWPVFEGHYYAIKHADLVALATERRDLLPDVGPPWPVLQGIQPVEWIRLSERAGMSAADWAEAFHDRAQELIERARQ